MTVLLVDQVVRLPQCCNSDILALPPFRLQDLLLDGELGLENLLPQRHRAHAVGALRLPHVLRLLVAVAGRLG